MRQYQVFQKFETVADYRNNTPMEKFQFLGTFDSEMLGLAACNSASQVHNIPALLLTAKIVNQTRRLLQDEEYSDQTNSLERPGY